MWLRVAFIKSEIGHARRHVIFIRIQLIKKDNRNHRKVIEERNRERPLLMLAAKIIIVRLASSLP